MSYPREPDEDIAYVRKERDEARRRNDVLVEALQRIIAPITISETANRFQRIASEALARCHEKP